MNGRDAFAVLPTSFCSLGILFDGMDPLCDQPTVVLVITLLTASMKDDVIVGDFIFRAFNCIPITQVKDACHQTHDLYNGSGSARLNSHNITLL